MNPALISRLAKGRYLLKLSEDDFRDQVVRPILLLRGYKDGRDLCGPTEQGKDAIFYDTDKLGSLNLLAIQTKKGSANLAAKAATNIVDLVAQLRTAASTSYVLLQPHKLKMKPTQVMLAVSGKINDAARRHLESEVHDTSLVFRDADDLIPWIDAMLPQLWLDIDSNVSTYYAAVEKQLIGGDGPFARQFLPVDPSLSKACFHESCVSVHVRRSAAVIERKKSSSKRNDDASFPLHALQSKPYKRVLLLGEGGAGKTIGLVQTVYRAAKLGLEGEKMASIPILAKATDLAASIPSELSAYLEEVSRKMTVQKKPVFGLSDLVSGRVCVFIDGFDEVGDQKARVAIAKLTSDFSDRFPKCMVVISARPYEYLAEIDELRNFERFNIVPINWRQAEQIVDLVKHKKEISSEKTREALSRLGQIQGFNLNPLMVSVFAATADFDLQDVPPNITELFKRFTEQMLGRWDEQRGLKTLHRPLVKDFALCVLALEMHIRRCTTISRAEAVEIISTKLAETGNKEDANGLLTEVLDRSGLFRDFGSEIGFRHHMFQEFFAGRGMNSAEMVGQYISDPWWRRSIVFRYGENPRNAIELEQHIAASSSKQASEQFGVSCTAGLALQACYLSPVIDKVRIWKQMVERLVYLRDPFLKDNDPHGRLPILSSLGYLLMLRDSLSLSNIAEYDNDLLSWIESQSAEQRQQLFAMYKFALMRIGRFDLLSTADIKELVNDPVHCIAVVLEFAEAESVRPLSSKQKDHAASIRIPVDAQISKTTKVLLEEVTQQIEMTKLIHAKIAERTAGDKTADE